MKHGIKCCLCGCYFGMRQLGVYAVILDMWTVSN